MPRVHIWQPGAGLLPFTQVPLRRTPFLVTVGFRQCFAT